MSSWAGRVALITGASNGIGAAIARRFSAHGCHVTISSQTSVDEGRDLAASLECAHYIQADLGDEDAPRRLVAETVEHFGRLDALINNAGTTVVIPHQDVEAVTQETWHHLLAVNLLGPWNLTVAALPHLRASGDGVVVNVSSMAGTRPGGSSIPYAVSKAALDHMTRLLARVVGPETRVNAVAPGLIETPRTANWNEARALIGTLAPLRRTGMPEEIAEIVMGLATATYLTGQVVLVDGGLSLVTGVEVDG